MELDYDKLAAAILRQQQQQPSVAREVALEGGGGWKGRGAKILGQWHKLEGGNFWIHALSGRGTFFICLSWLKNHRPRPSNK